MEVSYIVLGLFSVGYYLNRNGKATRHNNTSPGQQYEMKIVEPQIPKKFSAQPNGWLPEPEPNIKHVQNINLQNNATLDNFTGSGNRYIEHKRETVPLFKPTPTAQRNLNSDMQSIDNSRNTYQASQYLTNETPIEAQQVGPGLNKDPNVASSGGFHQTLRVVPTNVGTDLNQYEGRTIPGKSEVDKRTQLPENFQQNTNFRFYTRSDESFLPTRADHTKMMVRSDYESDIRNIESKTQHEQYFGSAVMYQENDMHASTVPNNRDYTDRTLRDTQRGDEKCMNGIISGQNQMPQSVNGYYTHQTIREETSQLPVGIASGGVNRGEIQSNHNVNTMRGASEQREFSDFASNVRGHDKSQPIVTGYRNDATNRENQGVVGQVGGIASQGYTNEQTSIHLKPTGKEATHDSYMGQARSSQYTAGMSYDELMNAEGYSLRSVTDENRTSGPQRINHVNFDPKDRLPDHHLREESNHARENSITPQNPLYGEIAKPSVDPNKFESINDRFDPALVQSQMQENPYRMESHGHQVSEPTSQSGVQGMEATPIF